MAKLIGLVKPPMSLFGIEGRYVNALYSAAYKNKKLDAIEGDLKKLSSLYKSDSKFRDYLINPLVQPSEKTKVFENDIKNKLKLNDLSVNLLSAMSENRRLNKLPAVESMFHQVMLAVRNEMPCTIISAKPLSEAHQKEIEISLKAITSKKLLFEYKQNPSIMGGIMVDFNGEASIDMTVLKRVRSIAELCDQ